MRLAEIFNITLKTTAAESPFSNGKCEKFVGLLKDSVLKLRMETTGNKEMSLLWSVAAKNELCMEDGFSPNQLVFGRNNWKSKLLDNTYRERGEWNTEGSTGKMLANQLRALEEARKIHMNQECCKRVRKAIAKPIREHKFEEAEIGDNVLYKRENDKEWRGPAKVIGRDGKTVIVKHGGYVTGISRVHITRIQETDQSCNKALNKRFGEQEDE